MLLKLAFKALEKGKGVGSTASKSGNNLVFIKAAHLAGVAFHDRIPEANLTVPANSNLAIAAN